MRKPALCVLLSLAAGASANAGRSTASHLQDGATEPPVGSPSAAGSLASEVDVRLIEIDLTVRDRKGRRIEGLSAEDFDVFEDGDPLGIESFEEFPDRPPVFPSLVDRGKGRRRQPTKQPAGQTSTRARPLIAIAIDQEAVAGGIQARAIRQDLANLLRRPEADNARWMGLVWDGEVRVVVRPGSSAAALAESLDTLVRPAARSVRDRTVRDRGIRQIAESYERVRGLPPAALALLAGEGPGPGDGGPSEEEQIETDPCDIDWRGMVDEARQYTNAARDTALRRLTALEQLVSTLGSLGEPTSAVVLADGLIRQPGRDGYHYVEELCPQAAEEIRRLVQVEDLTPGLQRIAALANARRVTLITVDGGGQRTFASADAATGNLETVPSVSNQRLFLDSLQSSLTLLAEETGGRAVLDTNQISSPLATALHDTQPQYRLTVRLTHPRSGRRHSLLVLPSTYQDWDLQYRRSYFDKTLAQSLADQLRNAMRHELQPQFHSAALDDVEIVIAAQREDPESCRLTLGARRSSPESPSMAMPGMEPRRIRVWAYGESASVELRPRERILPLASDGTFSVEIDVPLPRSGCRAKTWQIGVGVRDETTGALRIHRETVPMAEAVTSAE